MLTCTSAAAYTTQHTTSHPTYACTRRTTQVDVLKEHGCYDDVVSEEGDKDEEAKEDEEGEAGTSDSEDIPDTPLNKRQRADGAGGSGGGKPAGETVIDTHSPIAPRQGMPMTASPGTGAQHSHNHTGTLPPCTECCVARLSIKFLYRHTLTSTVERRRRR